MKFKSWMNRLAKRVRPQKAARRVGRSRSQPQLVLEWNVAGGTRPLRLSIIHPLRPLPKPVHVNIGPLGLNPEPFHFTTHMALLCHDIVARTPDLAHIDLQRVLLCTARARTRRPHGLQAKVTPMRFKHGNSQERRRGWTYQVQQYYVNGIEVLYLLSFCLPRFQDISFDEKMITIFHELFHMAPEFNGDLRRHDGRYYQHSPSKKKYDALMHRYVEAYFATNPDLSLSGFLKYTFEELYERHGSVIGVVVPAPKLVPLLP